MNAGSQCQYQRPSSRWRRFFFSPTGSSAAAGAGCSAGSRRPPRRATPNPSSMCSDMKAPIRSRPCLLDPGRDVDEHERGRDALVGVLTDRRERRRGRRATRRRAGRLRRARGDGEHVTGERVEGVVAVGGPLAVAVAAQVDGVRPPTLVREHVAVSCPTNAAVWPPPWNMTTGGAVFGRRRRRRRGGCRPGRRGSWSPSAPWALSPRPASAAAVARRQPGAAPRRRLPRACPTSKPVVPM